MPNPGRMNHVAVSFKIYYVDHPLHNMTSTSAFWATSLCPTLNFFSVLLPLRSSPPWSASLPPFSASSEGSSPESSSLLLSSYSSFGSIPATCTTVCVILRFCPPPNPNPNGILYRLRTCSSPDVASGESCLPAAQ